MYINSYLLARQTYFLLLEPVEEILRERRDYFEEKEKKYKLPQGSMNHFWIYTEPKFFFKNISAESKKRLLDKESKYISLLFAGKSFFYLPAYYKTRFAFIGKGKYKGETSFPQFSEEKINIKNLWE